MAFTSERSHLGGTDKGVSTPEKKEEILKKRACFRAGTTAGSEGAEVARTRATLSFSSSALKGRGCFRDRVTGTTSDAEASTASKKLAARSCTRSAGVEGAMARKMRRQAHPHSFLFLVKAETCISIYIEIHAYIKTYLQLLISLLLTAISAGNQSFLDALQLRKFHFRCQFCISPGHLQLGMSRQLSNNLHRNPVHRKPRAKSVAQRMERHFMNTVPHIIVEPHIGDGP